MAAPIWKIDGADPLYPGATYPGSSSYPTGAGSLTITSSPYFLTSQQLPLPDLDAQYGSSVTTEGDRLQTQRYRNRKISLSLRVIGSSAANLQTAINNLQAKVGKINRDAVIGGTGYGGTLEYTTVDGDVVIFDVCSATMSAELGKAYVVRNGTDVTLEFECAPFARGPEFAQPAHRGAGPLLTFVAGPSELLVNPSFEPGTAGWAFQGTGTSVTFARSSAWSSSGTYCLHLKTTVGTANYYGAAAFDNGVQRLIGVKAGSTYTLSADYNIVSGPAGSTAYVWLQWYDDSDVFLSGVTSSSAGSGTGTFTVSGTAPASATQARVVLVHGAASTTGTVESYWDNVQFSTPDHVVKGDVPALGRLEITNTSASDQATALWGLRSYHYSSDATAALLWQAEALTPMNAGASAAAGPTGASGSGSNTIKATALTTAYQPLLKSTVTSGGTTTYWTHKGAYRVYARVYGDGSGVVSMRASWSQADVVNFSTNTAKDVPLLTWGCLDLGVVRIPPTTSRWELRLEATSQTNGDDVYVDWIALIPIDEGSGVASAASATPAVTLVAQDTFDQGSATANGAALSPVGGSWATAGGDSTDFSIDTTNHRLERTATSDTATASNVKDGRFIVEFNSSGYAGQRASVNVTWSYDTTFSHGLLLRYTSATKFCAAVLRHASKNSYLEIITVDGSSVTTIAADTTGYRPSYSIMTAGIEATVTSAGYAYAVATFGDGHVVRVNGTSSLLATGGSLATGKYGIIDWQSAATANTRTYDLFTGWQITNDAAAFASRSLTVSYNDVHRQDSAGAVTTRPASYSGDYMLVPASGKESRTVQFAVRLGRGLIDGSGDDGTADSLSARLYVQPRYLQLPS